MNVTVNYLSVLLASVAAMGVGFAWYSPMMFAKPWMKYMGYTAKSIANSKQNMNYTYLLSMLAALVTAYVLYHVATMSAQFFSYSFSMAALTSAFWMWLGFMAPVQMTDVLFGGRKWGLFAINTGYQLCSLLAMAVVMGLLG